MNRIEKVKSIINHLFQSIELRDVFLIFTGIVFFDYIHPNPFFEWKEYELISQPSFFVRAFYSTLTFVTTGALIYYLKIYRFLYRIVRLFGTYRDWIQVKGVIWLGLMLGNYFYVVPWSVDILNFLISLVINGLRFVIYTSPHLGITIITTIFFGVIRKRYSERVVG